MQFICPTFIKMTIKFLAICVWWTSAIRMRENINISGTDSGAWARNDQFACGGGGRPMQLLLIGSIISIDGGSETHIIHTGDQCEVKLLLSYFHSHNCLAPLSLYSANIAHNV